MFQGLEQLQKVQMEVVDALKELHRMKQSYHRVGHMAHVAREKAADAQTRSVFLSEQAAQNSFTFSSDSADAVTVIICSDPKDTSSMGLSNPRLPTRSLKSLITSLTKS